MTGAGGGGGEVSGGGGGGGRVDDALGRRTGCDAVRFTALFVFVGVGRSTATYG
jgi:hypothetical protein